MTTTAPTSLPAPRGPRGRRRPAFTLAELAVSVALMSVLMVGMGSAVMLASRALPPEGDPLQAEVDSATSLDRLSQDLYCALAFTQLMTNAVTFTVPDRSGDNQPDTISYSWAGTAGDPIVRTFSDGTNVVSQNLLEGVHNFALRYDLAVGSHTDSQEADIYGDEELLVYFDGWGVPTGIYDFGITSTNWMGEYFALDVPEETTAVQITRAMVRMETNYDGRAGVEVGLYETVGWPGSPKATSTPIGSTANVPESALSHSMQWIDVAFGGNVRLTDLDAAYCLLLTGPGGSADLEYYYSIFASGNDSLLRATYDGGTSWAPSSSLDRYDFPFYLYGKLVTRGMADVEVQRYFLSAVAVVAQTGPGADTRLTTEVLLLNTPEVTP